MGEFAGSYVEILRAIGVNLWTIIKAIGMFFANIFYFDWVEYYKIIAAWADQFTAVSWLFLIIAALLNFALLFFINYRIVQLIRRYIIFRSKEVDKDKLMQQVTELQMKCEDLMKEKQQIFSLKVHDDVYRLGNGENSGLTDGAPVMGGGGAVGGQTIGVVVKPESETNPIRFSKLIALDDKYNQHPNFIVMADEDMLSLSQIVDRFIDFAASTMHLYYSRQTIMQFFAGLASSKIIILEGISGTGKTSLPYAMGKFFRNETTICSVQPSWRDRGELIGYYNDFTHKFVETDFLASVYEATLREDNRFIILDEMNLARIEYYFADFLSVMETPDIAEWKIEIVAEPMESDPKNLIYGKLLVPQNLWFVGTANNDDSTFTITDKVYDRAVAITLNNKADFFDAPLTESYNCSYKYINELFKEASQHNKVSDASRAILHDLDDFIQENFKVAFGNRVMKHINLFVPVYMECGGSEVDALDFIICTKILRKFTSLNLPFLINELNALASLLNKKFGKGKCKMCLEYIEDLKKNH